MTTLTTMTAPVLIEPDTAPARRSSALLGLSITFGGVLCTAIVVLVGLAALNGEANLLFLLFGISFGIILFSALAPMFMIRSVEVERISPEAVVASRAFRLVYVIRNHNRWLYAWGMIIGESPSRRPRPAFPRAFVACLAPGEERRVELTGLCPHRGRVSLRGVRVSSRFPFGLFACAVDVHSPLELIIYPAVGRFRRDPWKEHRYSGNTARSRDRHGGQDEFFGLREYRQGDNPRWVHWRRSARTGVLVVREMMPVRPTQLIVLLDPWPQTNEPQRRGARKLPPHPDVERLLSAAATAICDGLERGHRVGLICRAAVPVVIPPAAGRPQRQRLLQELALILPGAEEQLDQIISRIRWSSGWHARCLVCATTMDEAHGRLIRLLAGRAEAVMALSPQSETFDAIFEAEPGTERRGR